MASEDIHYNVIIKIEKTVKRLPALTPRRGVDPQDETPTRGTSTVVSLVVSAETEEGAYEKAERLLSASRPVPDQHFHATSCYGAGGSLLCGE